MEYDWVDRRTAQQILGIKEAQLRNDTSVLVELNAPGFDYIPKTDRGYSKSALQALIVFRKLVNAKGRKRAIEEINALLGQCNYEQAR